MTAYLLRRLWQTIPTLFGVVLLVFLLFKGFGGGPAEILGGLNASPEQVGQIRDQLGLNRPLWVQFGLWQREVGVPNASPTLLGPAPAGEAAAVMLAPAGPR